MKLHKLMCGRCQKPFKAKSPRFQFCVPCAKIRKAESTSISKPNEPGPAKIEAYQPRRRPVLISDKEQKKIDQAVDERLFGDCKSDPGRVIRPGDPEFEAVAAQITPVSRVRRGMSAVNAFCNPAYL